jgi:hypothetical protein
MKFDFPINKVEYDFELAGDCHVTVTINGDAIADNVIHGCSLSGNDVLKINFSKTDPTDAESYATLKQFKVNGVCYLDQAKVLDYKVDRSKHHDADDTITNNLYFGYVGSMEIVLEQTYDILKKAAWTLADKEFEYVKWPLRGEMYREKDSETVERDARFMFNGSMVADDTDINDYINSIPLKDLRLPINFNTERKKIENWINHSSRITISNFDHHPYFTYSNGVLESVSTLLQESTRIYMPLKSHFFNLEMMAIKRANVKDVFVEELDDDSDVFFEYPSPWYDNRAIEQKIDEAVSKHCRVSLDLTWLPMSNEKIQLDLAKIDQIFFSMTKTWPLTDFRPAWRWSKRRINDFQTIGSTYGYYSKAPAMLFIKMIDRFAFDFIYQKHKKSAEEINTFFKMTPTNILWFSRHRSVGHDDHQHISDHYYLDEFVCIKKLLDFKGKYFW